MTTHSPRFIDRRIPGRRLLHAPGPTPVPDEVLAALMQQPMDHGDPRLDEVIADCEAGLKRVLQTRDGQPFFFGCNGHGAWEAAIENLLPPGARVLVPGTGHFSEGWAVQAEVLGRRVTRTPWHPGLPIDAAAVEQALREDTAHEIAAVFVVHTDTSSGITSHLGALKRAVDAARHPALFVVDVVASLGCEPFAMDEGGADAVVGASQKGLMCPPGIGFLAVNDRAWRVAERNPAPRFYWDIVQRKSPLSYRKFCGTPPQNLTFALRAALALIEREGLREVLARHRQLAGLVHAAIEGWKEGGALGFFCREPAARSNAVTTITVPEGTDVDALRAVAREQFQAAFAGALGPLQGKGFRIGHLGDQNAANVLGVLGAAEAALRSLGVPVGDGVGRAVRRLADSSGGAGGTG
jgi:alanine-glyoxylate transaminase / serine-glyoxylate transaminase / serine-pyruvate transaminase